VAVRSGLLELDFPWIARESNREVHATDGVRRSHRASSPWADGDRMSMLECVRPEGRIKSGFNLNLAPRNGNVIAVKRGRQVLDARVTPVVANNAHALENADARICRL
jgi:hypothetical protein